MAHGVAEPRNEETFSVDVHPDLVSNRSEGKEEPLPLVDAVRREVAMVTTEMAPSGFSTFDNLLAEAASTQRVTMILLGLYACTALVLAGVGLYGVLAHSVARRTRELGLRMALGAQRSDVVALVLRQGMTLATVGLGIGLIGALAGTRVLSSLLFDTTPLDPAPFIGVAVLLALVALLACYIPARRATKVDPMVALRHE